MKKQPNPASKIKAQTTNKLVKLVLISKMNCVVPSIVCSLPVDISQKPFFFSKASSKHPETAFENQPTKVIARHLAVGNLENRYSTLHLPRLAKYFFCSVCGNKCMISCVIYSVPLAMREWFPTSSYRASRKSMKVRLSCTTTTERPEILALIREIFRDRR